MVLSQIQILTFDVMNGIKYKTHTMNIFHRLLTMPFFTFSAELIEIYAHVDYCSAISFNSISRGGSHAWYFNDFNTFPIFFLFKLLKKILKNFHIGGEQASEHIHIVTHI